MLRGPTFLRAGPMLALALALALALDPDPDPDPNPNPNSALLRTGQAVPPGVILTMTITLTTIHDPSHNPDQAKQFHLVFFASARIKKGHATTP